MQRFPTAAFIRLERADHALLREESQLAAADRADLTLEEDRVPTRAIE
jgi:hypothetical protein